MTKELEIKVLNIDVEEIQERILSLGGELISVEEQVNTLLDNIEKPIKSYMDAYLRIRETKELLSNEEKITLTLKKKLSNEALRENMEYNVNLEGKDTMLEILRNLGFKVVEVGHKERKSYKLKNSRLDIDTWDERIYPYPYMEIEVESERDLEELIDLLEIPRDKISRLSIVELQQKLKEEKDVK